ncbi:MAG: hypothetical protein R3F34_09430 [Planctomycetota bacterium]
MTSPALLTATPLGPLGWIVLATVLLVAWNLVRTDRALARFRSQRFAWWQDARTVWWGRIEPRADGFALRFDAPYAPPGEARRSAVLADPRLASSSIALVRPHSSRELFAELERRELVRTRERGGDAPAWWQEPGALFRSALDAATDLVQRLADPRRGRPCQDGFSLERARGSWVVLELACGAQVRGILVEIGRAWLALVTPHDDTTTRARVGPGAAGGGATDGDAPVRVEARGDVLAVAATTAPVEVESVTGGARNWSLGVTVLPGTELVLPFEDAAQAVGEVAFGRGHDVLAPRAGARVLFLSERDAGGTTP